MPQIILLDSCFKVSPVQAFQLSTLSVPTNLLNDSNESLSQTNTNGNDISLTVDAAQANNSNQLSSTFPYPHNVSNPHTHLIPFLVSGTLVSSSPKIHQSSPNIQNTMPHNHHPMITKGKVGIFKPKLYTVVLVHKEPDTVQEAINDENWFQAMKSEYDTLMTNGTWSLVPKSDKQKIIGNKWVYRVKYNTDGSIAKYKVRLVATGFQQIEGMNYFKTYGPVVKPATVRVVLSLVVMNVWQIKQVDMNNASLNGNLTEELYRNQPEGFVDQQRLDFVCKLDKALYGLKQAPGAWFDKFKGCFIQ